MASSRLQIRGTLQRDYADVFTAEALAALEALAPLAEDQKAVMASRIRASPGARRARATSSRSRFSIRRRALPGQC
jgi:hypothetical protein